MLIAIAIAEKIWKLPRIAYDSHEFWVFWRIFGFIDFSAFLIGTFSKPLNCMIFTHNIQHEELSKSCSLVSVQVSLQIPFLIFFTSSLIIKSSLLLLSLFVVSLLFQKQFCRNQMFLADRFKNLYRGQLSNFCLFRSFSLKFHSKRCSLLLAMSI